MCHLSSQGQYPRIPLSLRGKTGGVKPLVRRRAPGSHARRWKSARGEVRTVVHSTVFIVIRSSDDSQWQSALEGNDGRNRPAIQPETSDAIVSLIVIRLPDDGGCADMRAIVVGALFFQPDVVIVLRHGGGTVANVACRLQR